MDRTAIEQFQEAQAALVVAMTAQLRQGFAEMAEQARLYAQAMWAEVFAPVERS